MRIKKKNKTKQENVTNIDNIIPEPPQNRTQGNSRFHRAYKLIRKLHNLEYQRRTEIGRNERVSKRVDSANTQKDT